MSTATRSLRVVMFYMSRADLPGRVFHLNTADLSRRVFHLSKADQKGFARYWRQGRFIISGSMEEDPLIPVK